MSSLYDVEIGCEDEFKKKYSNLHKTCIDMAHAHSCASNWEFIQCMKTPYDKGPCVTYGHKDNEDLTMYIEFDSNGIILDMSVCED